MNKKTEVTCPKCGMLAKVFPSVSEDYLLIECRNVVERFIKNAKNRRMRTVLKLCGYRNFIKKVV